MISNQVPTVSFFPTNSVFTHKNADTGVSPPPSYPFGLYDPRWVTYGLCWKIFLQATAGICEVMEDVIKVETPNEGDMYMLDDVIKVSAFAVDDTDTKVVSLDETKNVKIQIIWCVFLGAYLWP